jgi:hypothetical protein
LGGGTMEILSIGEIIDKLIIENIKIFSLREKLNAAADNNEAGILNEKMMTLVANRSALVACLDRKIDNVANKDDINRHLKTIKTF